MVRPRVLKDGTDRVTFNLPPALGKWLRDKAATERRTLTAQVILLLEQAYQAEHALQTEEVAA